MVDSKTPDWYIELCKECRVIEVDERKAKKKNKWLTITCPVCNKEFKKASSYVKCLVSKYNQKIFLCSKVCSGKARNRRLDSNTPDEFKYLYSNSNNKGDESK
jgi:hypothetical protein